MEHDVVTTRSKAGCHKARSAIIETVVVTDFWVLNFFFFFL